MTKRDTKESITDSYIVPCYLLQYNLFFISESVFDLRVTFLNLLIYGPLLINNIKLGGPTYSRQRVQNDPHE